MGVFENKNYNYSLMEIKDENERKAVRKAKMEAVKEFFKVDTITELGTGSGGRTIVYQVNHYAVKLICGVTQKCNGENLNSKIIELDSLIAENLNINKNFCREMINMTKLSSITDNTTGKLNIIPFTGTATRLSWKCDSFNRIGVDYAIQMPLAKCLTDEMNTYKFQKHDIPKEHPEDFTKILTVGIDLCDALIVMHQNKLIHQDIKPQNIFLYHDNYCLGDFGIVREEDSPQFFQEGTRNYWAPEQANGSSVDHRCDIYSLGLVLYELADTVPVHNHYEQRIDAKKLPELESDIPEGLKKVLSNACEYEPDFRYQTAEAMKKDLCRLMEDPDYVPSSTRDNYYSSRKATSQPGRSQMSSGISLPSRNIMRSGPANFQRQRQANRFLQPETAWKAGKLWYEESRRTGCRFAGLNIDKTIMPLSAVSSNAVNFPINVSTNPEETVGLKPLSGVLKYPETLHNMYLIGEGGIGKTTALNSIMEDTYRDKAYHPAENGKNIIPLFVELSKAPADYCSAYHASHSTFIQRYLYMLLGSVDKQYLLSENIEEMSRIMERDDTSIMENIDQLLRADEEHTQYLLLLDGLNEVSKKQLSTKEKDFLGTPSELIVEEIKELLEKHKNITVIITSRADETLSDLDASFERLFLTGVSEDIIKEYLDGCKISSEQVSKNSRLMETLKIPLFLKLYGELYNTADISTPGEILYSFFSERSTKYTARNRIAEIKMDRQKAGDGYETNSLDEKMQGFILDFLLPELGWYMEKNDLYAVDLSTFKQVIDSVLKGEKETDICGIYGRKYFKEYLRGEDPAPNTQTYAKQLLNLRGPLDDNYASMIAKYCVYSLGILYANNQSYSFIHQHIRDFFAAMKIITDMKMALYISKCDNGSKNSIKNLDVINKDILSNTVIQYIGEILHEHLQSIENQNTSLPQNVLFLYRNIFFSKYAEEYGVWNLIKILYNSHKTLSGMDLSYLDLRNCPLNDIDLSHSDLTGSAVTHDTLFETVHTDSIQSIAYSSNGYLLYTGGRDGSLKIWHVKTSKCLKTIRKYHDSIMNISLNRNYLAISTGKITEIIDINTYKVCRRYHSINGVFSPSGEFLAVFYKHKKTQVINTTSFKVIGYLGYSYNPLISDGNMITFTSDSKYIAYTVSSRYNIFSEKSIEIWNLETFTKVFTICNEDDPYERISGIDFNQEGNSIVVAMYRSSINIYQLHLENKSYSFHCRFSLKREYGGTEINQVATSVKYVASTCLIIGDRDGGLHIYNLNYVNQPLSKQFHFYKKAHTYTISCVSIHFNKSQLYLAAGDTDGCIKIWDLNRKNVVKDLQNCNDKRILCSYYIKSTHEILMCNKKDILVFNLETGILSNNIFVSNIHHTAYEDNSKLFAIAYLNNVLNIYHYSEKFHFVDKIIVPCEKIEYIQFVANGKYLVINGDNKYFFKYDTQSNILKRLRFSLSQEGMKKKLISISGNAIIYTTYPHNGKIKAYDIINEKRFPAIKINLEKTPFKEVNDEHKIMLLGNVVCFSYQKSNYLTMKGGQVYKLNEYNHEYNLYLTNKGFNPPELFLSNDAKFLAVVTSDLSPEVQIYSVQTQEHLFDIYNLPRINKISSPISLRHILSYIAYNKVYYTNSKDFRLTLSSFVSDDIENFLYSIKQNLQFLFYKKYNGHKNGCVSSVSFVPFSEIFITSSFDGTIKIWKPTKCKKSPKTLTCSKTIKYIPGLKVKDAKIQKLSLLSDLSIEDIRDLKNYGAQLD